MKDVFAVDIQQRLHACPVTGLEQATVHRDCPHLACTKVTGQIPGDKEYAVLHRRHRLQTQVTDTGHRDGHQQAFVGSLEMPTGYYSQAVQSKQIE